MAHKSIGEFISHRKALEILISECGYSTNSETVDASDAFSRVLVETLYAPVNSPRLHMSHMDGYAVNSQALTQASKSSPVRLRVKGVIKAGQTVSKALRGGEAYRILTGGFLPPGADSVVEQEETFSDDGYVVISHAPKLLQNVDKMGGDAVKGEQLFAQGHKIRSQDIAFLTSLGIHELKVFSGPTVGIMSVGSELTDSQHREEGQIFNSHALALRRLVEVCGGMSKYLGVIPDDLKQIAESLAAHLSDLDMLLTVGGSSVSEIDFVHEASKTLHVSRSVHGIRLQPGRVSGFSIVANRPIIFLPGLFQSTINAFIYLAYPLLRKMIGLPVRHYESRVKTTLGEDLVFRRFVDFHKVVWVKLRYLEDNLEALPVLGESSRINVIAKSDAFIEIPEGQSRIDKGASVWAHFVPGLNSTENFE